MGAAPNTYARAFHTADGATTELHATLERARDERFRLIRLIKEVETRLASSPPPAPTDKIERLTDKVQHLDEALNQRFNKLGEVESRIDKRLDQLSRLEQAIRDLTDRFGNQVQQARAFDTAVADARRQVQLAGDVIVEDTRGRLHQLADAAQQCAAARLDEQIETLAAAQVERHLSRLGDQLDHRLTDFESRMDGRIETASAAALQRFEAERRQVADQLANQHGQMLEQLANDLQGQQRDAMDRISEHVDGIEATFAREVEALVDRATSRIQHAAAQFRGNLDSQIAAAHDQAEAASAAVEQTLRARLDTIRAATDGIVSMIESEYAHRIESIPHQAAGALELAERQTRDRLTRLQGDALSQVERTIAPLRKQIIDALQRVHRDARQAEGGSPPGSPASQVSTPAPVVAANVHDLIRRLSEPVGGTPDAGRDAA